MTSLEEMTDFDIYWLMSELDLEKDAHLYLACLNELRRRECNSEANMPSSATSTKPQLL